MTENSKCRLIVGALGHRSIEQPDVIIQAVDLVLDTLMREFNCSRITVLSSLAEGADRLIARRCMALANSRLIAALPMPVEEYAQDFITHASSQEFHGLLRQADEVVVLSTSSDRLEAYRTAGEYLVHSSTVLVAIWDGLPARGLGGTAETVTLARDRNQPLAWIYSPHPGDFAKTHDSNPSKAGFITLERLPGLPDSKSNKE